MITLTEKATDKIKKSIQKRGKGLGVKIGVKTTGCSGLAYTLEYLDTLSTDLLEYDNEGAKVFVSPKDIVYLNGLIVDYVRNGLNEGFEFKNPNERDRCGCGESFRI